MTNKDRLIFLAFAVVMSILVWFSWPDYIFGRLISKIEGDGFFVYVIEQRDGKIIELKTEQCLHTKSGDEAYWFPGALNQGEGNNR